MQKNKKIFYFSLCFYSMLPAFLLLHKLNLSNFILTFWVVWGVVGFAFLFNFWKSLGGKDFKHVSSSLRDGTVEQDIEEYKIENRRLLKQLNLVLHEFNQKNETEKVLNKKIEQLKEMHQHQENEYHFLNQDLQSQLEKRERALSETRLLVKEQRQVIEKKQAEINVLNLQINDLKYEIESLLQIEEQKASFIPQNKSEKSSLIMSELDTAYKKPLTLKEKLQWYIDFAKQLTETNPFAKRGGTFPFGTLLIDQRRLFDRLENDESEVMLVYSLQENRFIFVNNQIKNLLGWNPDQFIKDFSFLVQKGLDHWQGALRSVPNSDIQEIRLLMKTHSGQNILTHCYLKNISEGVFEGHAIGLLSSAAKR